MELFTRCFSLWGFWLSMAIFLSYYTRSALTESNSIISTYKLFQDDDERKDWRGANASCANEGGYLAAIETIDEFNNISEILRTNFTTRGQIWIGGEKLSIQNPALTQFNWVNGAAFIFTERSVLPWANNEPNNAFNSNERCIEIRGSVDSWNDENCNNVQSYLCEFEVVIINKDDDQNDDPNENNLIADDDLLILAISASAGIFALIVFGSVLWIRRKRRSQKLARYSVPDRVEGKEMKRVGYLDASNFKIDDRRDDKPDAMSLRPRQKRRYVNFSSIFMNSSAHDGSENTGNHLSIFRPSTWYKRKLKAQDKAGESINSDVSTNPLYADRTSEETFAKDDINIYTQNRRGPTESYLMSTQSGNSNRGESIFRPSSTYMRKANEEILNNGTNNRRESESSLDHKVELSPDDI